MIVECDDVSEVVSRTCMFWACMADVCDDE